MGDCITCIKRLLLISGASISIVGVFIMAVAVWIFLENDPIRHILMANSIVSVSINCLLIFGIILFLVGVVGCFGAIREKQFFLSLFFMAIIFLFILQLLAGVLAFLNRDKLYKTTFVDQMNRTLTSKPPDLFGSENWVNVMREFECCGVIGLSDSTDIEFIRTCCAVATLEDREHCLAYKNNKDSPVSNSPVPVLKKVMVCSHSMCLKRFCRNDKRAEEASEDHSTETSLWVLKKGPKSAAVWNVLKGRYCVYYQARQVKYLICFGVAAFCSGVVCVSYIQT